MRSFIALISLFFLMACNRPKAPAEPQLHPVTISVDTLNLYYALEKSNELLLSLLSIGLLPDDSINAKIQAHFNQEVLNLAGSGDFTFSSKEQLADSLKAEFTQVYSGENTLVSSWDLNQHLRVVLNDSLRLGLSLQQESYLGGAHPNRYSLYLYYSLSTGAILSLEDFTPAGNVNGLLQLAEKVLRQEYEVAANTRLETAGFWLEKGALPLPKNFWVEGDTLHLVYNPYEIAPYAMGTIVITLRPADLQKLSVPAKPST